MKFLVIFKDRSRAKKLQETSFHPLLSKNLTLSTGFSIKRYL